MELPVKSNHDLVLRLVSDIEQEKYFGNPFDYLVKNWDERGQAIVNAACETLDLPIPLSKQMVEDHSLGAAIYRDLMDKLELPVSKEYIDCMFEVLDSVLTLCTLGLGEDFIQGLYQQELQHYQDMNQFRPEKAKCVLTQTIRAVADIADAEFREHDRALAELNNAEVHDPEVPSDVNR